jgi:hypothetical protein
VDASKDKKLLGGMLVTLLEYPDRPWVKVASSRRMASSSFISFSRDTFDDEPIEGLDVLAIAPHLVVQAILDCQDEIGEFELTSELLADFGGIGDEELAILQNGEILPT